MISVSSLEPRLKDLFVTQANVVARETGFVQRSRKLSGADVVQGLTFGWLHNPQATCEQLARSVQPAGETITASGLSQRFTPQAVAFLQEMLTRLVSLVVSSPPVPIPLLQRFTAVILEDSSIIALPDALSKHWQGCGGSQRHTEAAIKLHVRWDLLNGTLSGPILTNGRVADQRSPLREQGIAPGSLYITDEGYFALGWLKRQGEAGGWFLTRPRHNTAFFDEAGKRLDLVQLGPQVVGQQLDLRVLVGTLVRLPARLLMVRVPEEVIAQRQQAIRETARKHGQAVNPQHLALAAWTILITNVSKDQLTLSEVLVLQRARWQIELLFKLWKEEGKIDEWRTKNPWRILCEIMGKLMAMVIQHWAILHGCWQDPARSMVKAAQVVRSYALAFLDVLRGDSSLQWLWSKLQQAMSTSCRLNRRAADPSLFQLLLGEPLPWLLT